MICKDCAHAVDDNKPEFHPADCGCDCQHKPVKAGQIVESVL